MIFKHGGTGSKYPWYLSVRGSLSSVFTFMPSVPSCFYLIALSSFILFKYSSLSIYRFLFLLVLHFLRPFIVIDLHFLYFFIIYVLRSLCFFIIFVLFPELELFLFSFGVTDTVFVGVWADLAFGLFCNFIFYLTSVLWTFSAFNLLLWL